VPQPILSNEERELIEQMLDLLVQLTADSGQTRVCDLRKRAFPDVTSNGDRALRPLGRVLQMAIDQGWVWKPFDTEAYTEYSTGLGVLGDPTPITLTQEGAQQLERLRAARTHSAGSPAHLQIEPEQYQKLLQALVPPKKGLPREPMVAALVRDFKAEHIQGAIDAGWVGVTPEGAEAFRQFQWGLSAIQGPKLHLTDSGLDTLAKLKGDEEIAEEPAVDARAPDESKPFEDVGGDGERSARLPRPDEESGDEVAGADCEGAPDQQPVDAAEQPAVDEPGGEGMPPCVKWLLRGLAAVGVFIAGGFFTGLFNEAGADTYRLGMQLFGNDGAQPTEPSSGKSVDDRNAVETQNENPQTPAVPEPTESGEGAAVEAGDATTGGNGPPSEAKQPAEEKKAAADEADASFNGVAEQ